MKKGLLFFAATLLSAPIFAGGILTNANQSVAYVRMLSRGASTQIDAVYYNPAGLIRLENGFHLSLNTQTLFINREIVNDHYKLNNSTYEGKTIVPSFPTFFVAYKKDKWAISFGFGPNSGGGKATYDRGLPSFEAPIAMIPVTLTKMGINTENYKTDIAFNGSSIFWGSQLNFSYSVLDQLGLSAGVRMINAVNTYNGTINNIQINPRHPANANGIGNFILASQFFTAIGQTAFAEKTKDKKVDVKQTGTGFTPIIGANISLMENKLNIGIKYEFKTDLKLTNDTKIDQTGKFTNDSTFNSDLPALLSFGVEYQLFPELKVSSTLHHYFDKNANWEGKEKFISNNLYELGTGVEYTVNEKIRLSAGYLYIQTGVGQGYQTDINYSLSSHSVSFGGAFSINEKLLMNVGVLYTSYVTGTVDKYYDLAGNLKPLAVTPGITAKETYSRNNLGFGIGFDYHF